MAGTPLVRRIDRRAKVWTLRIGVVVGLVVLVGVWSLAGAPVVHAGGSSVCVAGPAVTDDYLTGRACPPEGFVELLGYRPRLILTTAGYRYEKPAGAGGSCSGPLTEDGPFWSFGDACRTHDYGYDLVRFGVGDRAAADRQLYADMLLACDGQGPGRLACRAIAKSASATLQVGDAAGFDPEPVAGVTPAPGPTPAGSRSASARTACAGGAW
ncbi:MAG TPA: hypothetical protein VIB62_03360 [Actinomycetota bacterium]|jgi:hypothetical protein